MASTWASYGTSVKISIKRPNGHSNGGPDEDPYDIPDGGPDEGPYGGPNGSPDECLDGRPNGGRIRSPGGDHMGAILKLM